MNRLSVDELQQRSNEAKFHSSEIWYYAGDKDNDHVIVITRGGKRYFLVEKEILSLDYEKFNFVDNKNNWQVIKKTHMKIH